MQNNPGEYSRFVKEIMPDNHPVYADIIPLTTSRQTVARWGIAAALSWGVAVLFFVMIFSTEQDIVVRTPPVMYLDYIVLQPQKKKMLPPKIQKHKTVPKEVEEPVVQPRAEAPVAPSEQIAAPVEITTSIARVKKKQQLVRILSSSELDNTDFDPIFNPKPRYPLVALRNNIEGYVDVDLLITEKGRVEKISLFDVTGHPSFGGAVVKTVAKWRFPPPRLKGEKVRVKYVYRINFTLH